MEKNDFVDLDSLTIAEIKEAISKTENEMKLCLKNKNIKSFLEVLKLNFKLNKHLDRTSLLVKKTRQKEKQQ